MRLINRAEVWQKAYDAFQQVNFSAWDFNTIKQSLIDYIKIYRAEDFSDFIESSEFITLLEIFAYVGELLAYRSDMNSHENFMTIADRKESVLRLARYISYNASRNLPARGLVKIMSVVTSERVFDSNGEDLTNRVIYWNDPNNTNWKEQFILVINKSLEQKFGSVLPSDRVQINDILFELYQLNSTTSNDIVTPFNISVSGNTYQMEIVPVKLDSLIGPYEKRPEKDQKLSILFLSDGLGDSSSNTGFFFLVKQGILSKTTTRFDGVTPNQYFEIITPNCNETDIWLNNIDDVSGEILIGNGVNNVRDGEWHRVDVANSQNILFNTNPFQNKFETQTLADDKVRIIFGDGIFAKIPSGKFDIWYRSSANIDLIIPTSSIQNVAIPIAYNGAIREEYVTFSISLTGPLQNSAPSEDIEHIRRIAPAVYYTQDRMVNGRDYNEFMLQDNSILKLRSINRTFIGDSKYIKWHDAKENYENVKIFGDDLVIYYNSFLYVVTANGFDLPNQDGGANVELIDVVLNNYISPLLQTETYFIKSVLYGIQPLKVRKTFSNLEKLNIQSALLNLINASPDTFYLRLDYENNTWLVENVKPEQWDMEISVAVDGNWSFTFNGIRLVAHSDSTKFWINNGRDKITTYDTLNPNFDNIVVLKANTGFDDNVLLDNNHYFRILRQEIIEQGYESGNNSIHDLHIIPEDINKDGLPDDITLSYLIDRNRHFVYFYRDGIHSPWIFKPYTVDIESKFEADTLGLWKREIGREGLNFAWFHRSPRYHLIDPSATNIIDTFIIQRGYYLALRMWLSDKISTLPSLPTPLQLRADYSKLIDSKMISDTLILHPGKIKIIFGKKASPELQATIKIIRNNQNRTLSNNQVKTKIVDLVNTFFDIERWEFGQTFYFSELASFIHYSLSTEIDSVVIVPHGTYQSYGDLQQIICREDEILQPHITVNEVEIVESLNPKILKQTL